MKKIRIHWLTRGYGGESSPHGNPPNRHGQLVPGFLLSKLDPEPHNPDPEHMVSGSDE